MGAEQLKTCRGDESANHAKMLSREMPSIGSMEKSTIVVWYADTDRGTFDWGDGAAA